MRRGQVVASCVLISRAIFVPWKAAIRQLAACSFQGCAKGRRLYVFLFEEAF